MFPTNVPAVTVWAKDISGRAPTFARHVYGPSYWQDCRGEDEARTPENNVFIAIPVGSILTLDSSPSINVTSAPICFKIERITETSFIFGKFSITHGSSASTTAGIIATAAFFAPLTEISP